jgi:hypothetical protein
MVLPGLAIQKEHSAKQIVQSGRDASTQVAEPKRMRVAALEFTYSQLARQ